jgi:hypothetical protein
MTKESEPRLGQEIFIFTTASVVAVGFTQPAVQWSLVSFLADKAVRA